MSLKEQWGNPKTSSFKQKFIRGVKAGGIRVQVHKELVDVVTGLLKDAVDEYGKLPAIKGYTQPAPDANLSFHHFGIALSAVKELSGLYERYGFKLDEELGSIVFVGTPGDAEKISLDAETSRIEASLPQAGDGVWYTGGAGSRVLKHGDMGDDVMCFQLALDCPTQSGHFDDATAALAKSFNGKLGITHDVDTVNEDSWKMLTRLRRGMMSRGDVHGTVRVLQAALVAYDWDHNLRITGNFDRATDAAVRGVQGIMGLRESGIVRAPEWTAILQHRSE